MPLRVLMASSRNRSMKSLTSSPSFCLVRRRVCMLMSASSSKKRPRNSAFKSSQQEIEPFGSLQNHSKATPLRVLMNSRVLTGSFPIRLPVCEWKVVDMLLRRPFAIECVEGWHFKSRWVLDRVPLDWVGPSSSGFLPNSGGLEGSDLLLKSLHPVTGVTIGGLNLGLYFALIVSLGWRLDFVIRLMRRMEANGSIRVGALPVLAVACRASMLGPLLADTLKYLLN